MITEFNLERSSKSTVYRTAIYLRLSREDGDKYESDSISNQRKLIQDYISNKSEFCLVDEYVDDGYSGSNFDRPGWKQLYEDLECGAVNCIIVKDLSRFGRNYIEVGRYLQMIFPVMGVRMVAVNDNYDSLNDWRDGDGLMIPIKNLINDIYCQDISKKVTTQLNAMRKRGECVSPFLPYGYKRDPMNHSHLIIDEAVAPNVKQIFVWKLEGYSDRVIADKLNEQGILSPYEYKQACGEKMSCGFKKYDKANHTRERRRREQSMGRRNQVAKSTQRYLKRTTTAEWRTALYARLSDENNGLEDDRSLQNQIKYLQEYVDKKPDLAVVDTYVDNGRSGLNFERVEFKRMMEDVKNGTINCIVVKDLSRFGRNHIEAGYYLEKIFPQMDVRFISINDNFDSISIKDIVILCVSLHFSNACL